MTDMVSLLDTTLREGEQTPGVYFPPHVKMAVARMLDEIGIDIIEAGHPAVTEEIAETIRRLSRSSLQARLGAHARTTRSDIELALECGASFVGLFFCLTDERMKDLNCDLPQAVRRITELVAFAREKKPDLWIRYTPEDTVRSSWETVTAVAAEAVRAGADIISIADTTGRLIPGTPHNMYDWVSRLKEALAGKNLFPRFAVHCHNDRGLAVANALDGFRAGADIIDVSVLGLGERAGIADLASLLALFNQDFASGKPWKLEKIPELYRIVSRYAGVPIPVHFPVVGRNAFTHCAGVHTQAALKNPLHYQSLDPLPFGRRPEIALDHMSGQAALQHSLERIGQADLPKEFLGEILLKVKAVGQTGRAVDLEELEWIVKYQKEKWGLIEET